MSFIKNLIADRFRDEHLFIAKEDYKFLKIKLAKDEALKKRPFTPILDLGVGEPDKGADPSIVEVLFKEALDPQNRFYADNGIEEFKVAAKNYLKEIYHVNVDWQHEILHGIGAKSILSMLPMCFINPGDITLMPVPNYPILSTHAKYLGGPIYPLPLTKENDFFPDFSTIPDIILKRSKLLYINYPNNPTGQIPTQLFYKKVVDFAKKNEIIVIADSSYGSIVFDSNKPLSFLSIPGAKDVGVEIHSLSKAFNMTGWRLAFIAGNPQIIDILSTVKANSDSGQFRAIQKAGIYALSHPEITRDNCTRYARRLNLLVQVLKEVGFCITKPKGTFYCYVPIPKKTKSGVIFNNADDFCMYLLKTASICAVPWNDPKPFIRFSVTFECDKEKEEDFMKELKQRLLNLELIF